MRVNEILVVEECCNCHVLFAIPEDMQRRLRETHHSFYCPNGHSQSYTDKTEAQKLQAQLQAERERTQFWRDEEGRTKKALTATKGQLTKTKNRVANGVCPCCHRSFVQLERHMSTKHPEFAVPA